MPALDDLLGSGATHIADQNKHVPVKTLCGQALDKDSTRYFADPDNFQQATCKVCRGVYFDEDWRGEQRSEGRSEEPPQETAQEASVEAPVETAPEPNKPEPGPVSDAEQVPTRRLFSKLEVPVNSHPKKDATDDLGNGGEKSSGS